MMPVHHQYQISSWLQVAMRFLLQEGIAIIPKSVTPSRIVENSQVSVLQLKAIYSLNWGKNLVNFALLCHSWHRDTNAWTEYFYVVIVHVYMWLLQWLHISGMVSDYLQWRHMSGCVYGCLQWLHMCAMVSAISVSLFFKLIVRNGSLSFLSKIPLWNKCQRSSLM